MSSSIEKLDEHLQRSDSDSAAWADGGGAEEAKEFLTALPRSEWARLESLCLTRGARWRACLATILHPGQGEFAAHLLLNLAWDADDEVAFLAVSGIAFHCGVDDSAAGPFTDSKIRDHAFLSAAQAHIGLPRQVRRVGALCHPRIQRRFEMLVRLLEPNA